MRTERLVGRWVGGRVRPGSKDGKTEDRELVLLGKRTRERDWTDSRREEGEEDLSVGWTRVGRSKIGRVPAQRRDMSSDVVDGAQNWGKGASWLVKHR